MKTSIEFFQPTRIVIADGVIGLLPEYCNAHGKRVLIIYSAELKVAANDVIALLVGASFDVIDFMQTDPEPTCALIDVLATEFKDRLPNSIVGLGGGSAIDLAKALSIALTNPGGIWMYANLSNRPPLPIVTPPIPLYAIPTTSGTGAEVTPYSVLTNEETFQKGTIQNPAIFPRVALIDPRYCLSMPPSLTASTGIDALAHALEASLNTSKPSPFAEVFGTKAINLILEWLPAAYKNGHNIEARRHLALASCMAGIAISHRGTTAAHAIAEPLGALTKLPHSVSVAVATLPVLRATLRQTPTPLADIAKRVLAQSIDNSSEGNLAEDFYQKIDFLMGSVGMKLTLRNLLPTDIIERQVPKLVDNIITFKSRPLKQHPVEFNRHSLELIVADMLNQDNSI